MVGKILTLGVYFSPAKKCSSNKNRRCKMIKKTKHGRISRGSEHGESPCKDCGESALGEEVVLVFYPKEVHVDRHHIKCFLEENPRYKVRYEIVMATIAMNGISEPSFQGSCNLCGLPTKGENVIVCAIIGKMTTRRKLFSHLSCFMSEDKVRSAPDVHISTR